MNPDQILEISGLVTSFKGQKEDVQAVKGIDFQIPKGKTVGIVGESGSGKSVTALSIMRLLDRNGYIAEGEIRVQIGEEVQELSKLPEAEMRKLRGNEIAMIFQEPMTSLNPVYTCGMQVAEAIRLHQKADKKLQHWDTHKAYI